MKGWGLAILNNKKTDQEMGPTTSYLVIHKNPKKWSIWSSKIFGAPIHVVHNITKTIQVLQIPVEVNDTNGTNSTNATAPAPPAPTVATPVTAAPAGNASNHTNASNKTNKTRALAKRKLPVPFAGIDNEEDDLPENQDLSTDLDDDEDCDDDDESLRDKIVRSLMMYQVNSGYLDVKWFRCLKPFDKDDDDEDKN